MSKNLVIVESPAKAKTIESFLGKDFSVKSCFGHIRDLPSKGMSIDIDNNFAPEYKVNPDKQKVVRELKAAAKKADTVWLASDEDREGEAIAWHLLQALKLDESKTKRIVFHEITKPAILAAIENPRTVNMGLVDAQQARRVLDRLVGYKLSPVLWKKVQRGLSAGRVQSVAVRLAVEREREIRKFEAESDYKLQGEFSVGGNSFIATGKKRAKDYDHAMEQIKQLVGASFSVDSIYKKPGLKSPSAPFTTSTLQQEASRRLGSSVKRTMMLAQRLYEAGHITYMRTDSLNLSDTALAQAETHIHDKYGSSQHKQRTFKTKSSGAQEAHEAIRPTNFSKLSAGADESQKKLYQLIWQRTLASQMVEAKLEKTTLQVANNKSQLVFEAKGEVLVDPGWLAVYPGKSKDSLLPKCAKGDELKDGLIEAVQQFSKPPARYTEASLVRKLEELGIGRPSTYAPTISTIQDRGYIAKGELEGQPRDVKKIELKNQKITEVVEKENHGSDKGKLIPTDTAMVVTDFLVKNFDKVTDYKFTASVEQKFDTIAANNTPWQDMIADFYKDFEPKVAKAENISRKDAGGMKELGTDPKTKRPVFARVGRYGPMVQIGQAEDEEKPKFGPMPEGKNMDSITLEDALKMFELPRVVGQTEDGEEITANVGRFGPYVKVGSMYASIKPEDPFSIDLESAREFIKQKKEAEANKYIKTFDDEGIQIINGRYGPYITDGKKNAKIPKDTEPAEVTLEQAKELLEKAPARGARRRYSKKKS